MAKILPSEILVFAGGTALARYGVLVKRTAPWEEVTTTPSRSTVGYSFTRDGILVPSAADIARVEWLDLDGDGVRETPAYLSEPERENLLTRSEEFDHGDWSNANQPVLTPDAAVAPDGTTTAYGFAGDADSVPDGRGQVSTISDNSSDFVLSIFAKKANGARGELILRMLGGTTEKTGSDVKILFDLDEAGPNRITSQGSEVESSGVEDVGNGWVRIHIVVANNGTGNTTAVAFVKAFDEGQTNVRLYFWGAQLEEGSEPSSYFPTTTAAAPRAEDSFAIPIGVSPSEVPFTFYAHFEARQDAVSSTDEPILVMWPDSITVVKAAGGLPLWSYGDEVKIRAVMSSSGNLTLGISINGATESVAGPTAGGYVPGAWGSNECVIGGARGEIPHGLALITLMIASGEHSLSELEAAV